MLGRSPWGHLKHETSSHWCFGLLTVRVGLATLRRVVSIGHDTGQ
jgi:hypothetical protein